MNSAQIITAEILEKMAQAEKNGATFHWVKPYDYYGGLDKPYAYDTQIAYRGINRLLLENDEYLTYNKIVQLSRKEKRNYTLRPGCKGHRVCYYGPKKQVRKETDEQQGEEESSVQRLLRYYYVFSRQDVIDSKSGENLPSRKPFVHYTHHEADQKIHQAVEKLKKLALHYCARYGFHLNMVYDGTGCWFDWRSRTLSVSALENWPSIYEWASALLHELSHSTGLLLGRFENGGSIESSSSYCREELVAELSSAFLLNELGFPDDRKTEKENTVAYIAGWSAYLKDKPHEILAAAAKAQASMDLIMECALELEEDHETA